MPPQIPSHKFHSPNARHVHFSISHMNKVAFDRVRPTTTHNPQLQIHTPSLYMCGFAYTNPYFLSANSHWSSQYSLNPQSDKNFIYNQMLAPKIVLLKSRSRKRMGCALHPPSLQESTKQILVSSILSIIYLHKL